MLDPHRVTLNSVLDVSEASCALEVRFGLFPLGEGLCNINIFVASQLSGHLKNVLIYFLSPLSQLAQSTDVVLAGSLN